MLLLQKMPELKGACSRKFWSSFLAISLRCSAESFLARAFAASSASPTSCQFGLLTQIIGSARRARRKQTVHSRATRVHRRNGFNRNGRMSFIGGDTGLMLTRERQRLVSLSRRTESFLPLPPRRDLLPTHNIPRLCRRIGRASRHGHLLQKAVPARCIRPYWLNRFDGFWPDAGKRIMGWRPRTAHRDRFFVV